MANKGLTIKEAILKSLADLKNPSTTNQVYSHIVDNNYYVWTTGKTPERTISAQLGTFITKGDSRVKRIKGKGRSYLYYLSKNEQYIDLESTSLTDDTDEEIVVQQHESFIERDLHLLLSSYLRNKNIFSKTILHEKSKIKSDRNQKWIHPDMIGIEFIKLSSKVNQAFMKTLNKLETFKLYSYEIKKEIKTDYELKNYYFQAVSNSSWANYGYLVAFEINDNLMDEIERLNKSFGIGIIKLKSNPYESKILFQSKHRDLDFRTIDKLCRVNEKYEKFIELTEQALSIDEKYYKSIKNDLDSFCDSFFENDSEIEKYRKEKHIPDN